MKVILVVDDCVEILRLFKTVIENNRYLPLLASSGKEAMSLLEKSQVDLIISDYEMPEGDGLWLLEQMKSLELPPPVIILTGTAGTPREEFLRRGALAHFKKPVSLIELMGVVGEVLSKR